MEHLYYSITNFNDPSYSYSMSVENDDELIEQNSEEIEMEDDNEGKVAIVEETVELSEPGRVVREEVTRIENLREYEEQEEEQNSKGVEKKGSIIESTTTKNIDYLAKQLEGQTNQIKKLTDTILPLQTHVQSQFEMLQDVQSKLNKLQTTVEDIIKSKKVINSRAKQPTKKIGNTKKHRSKKLAKSTKR